MGNQLRGAGERKPEPVARGRGDPDTDRPSEGFDFNQQTQLNPAGSPNKLLI
jgi:hypothetical protein